MSVVTIRISAIPPTMDPTKTPTRVSSEIWRSIVTIFLSVFNMYPCGSVWLCVCSFLSLIKVYHYLSIHCFGLTGNPEEGDPYSVVLLETWRRKTLTVWAGQSGGTWAVIRQIGRPITQLKWAEWAARWTNGLQPLIRMQTSEGARAVKICIGSDYCSTKCNCTAKNGHLKTR